MTGWTQAYSDTFPGAVDLQARSTTASLPAPIRIPSPRRVPAARSPRRSRGSAASTRRSRWRLPDRRRQRGAADGKQHRYGKPDHHACFVHAAGSRVRRRRSHRDRGRRLEPGVRSALNLTRDLALSLHYQLRAATGTYSISNWALSGGTPNNYGIMFALRPAGPASPLTINVPAGTVANDVMIASITMRPCSNTSGAACTTTVTAPGGWTQVGTTIDQTTGAGAGRYGHRLAIYRRVATGAEPASYPGRSAARRCTPGRPGRFLRSPAWTPPIRSSRMPAR